MENPLDAIGFEFLKPLVKAWSEKLEAARSYRSHWTEVVDEITMFYSKSAAAMWDPSYDKKFWKGIKAPKFRMTINKAFEWIAITHPNLYWECPNRTVTPKRRLQIPQSLLMDPVLGMQIQQLMPMQQMSEEITKMQATLMETWLNYTPGECDLSNNISRMTFNAALKGRGVAVNRIHKKAGSSQILTSSFNLDPEYLYVDPDVHELKDAKWIGIKHIDPHYEVERRFNLPPNSLKQRSSLESSWTIAELRTDDMSPMHRAAGQTNDLVVWYEIYSKMGPGTRMSSTESVIRDHLEQVVQDYAYIAICPACPYPLNCTSDFMRQGATDEMVKAAFEWPVPIWADDAWPIEVCDFYEDTKNSWPVPPLQPALGELKLLNFLIPWACNRVWSSSRDFWAVAKSHLSEYKSYLLEGDDQCVLPVPMDVDDVRKAVSLITQSETRQDIWRIIEMVSTMFDKRTGLVEGQYGRNEDGTQNRTAEETIAKQRAYGVRHEFMQKKLVEFNARIASREAFMARWFVTGEHVEPLMGPVGRMLWEHFIMSQDVNAVVRQMEYQIDAASIRRPNRDRDIANYQAVMQQFLPTSAQYGFQTGDFTSFNTFKNRWGKYHDADMSDSDLGPLMPPAPQPPMGPEGDGDGDEQGGQQPPQQGQQPQPQQQPMQQMQPQMQMQPPTQMMQGGLPPELAAVFGQPQPQQF